MGYTPVSASRPCAQARTPTPAGAYAGAGPFCQRYSERVGAILGFKPDPKPVKKSGKRKGY